MQLSQLAPRTASARDATTAAAAAAAAADADSVAIGDVRRAPYSCSLFRSQWSLHCCHRVTSYQHDNET